MPIISNFPSGNFNNNDIIIPDGLPELGRTGGLNAYTWEEVSAVSLANLGDTYWAVGDTHSVALNGTVGTLSLNATYYAYILGFNHNRYIEGDGIQFGTFKTAQSDGKDVALVSNYLAYTTDGTKNFNMNHWGNLNYGGWKGCDLRYDILGSTNTAPSGYGAAVAEGRTGYDAGTTTATNPVANTLMAAFPSDLRAVMKPITKYTDNMGGAKNTVDCVTETVDYLPLLSDFEIFGRRTYSNLFEHNYQEQYAYYQSGNSRVKFRHDALTSTALWWERSPYYGSAVGFCIVYSNGGAGNLGANYSLGLAPAFKV